MKKTLVLAVNEDLTNCLKNINCPTLLFWGDKDDATPISDAKTMEKKIPDAGLVVLEGGSHFSFLEKKSPKELFYLLRNTERNLFLLDLNIFIIDEKKTEITTHEKKAEVTSLKQIFSCLVIQIKK